jgi:hypothetical protein
VRWGEGERMGWGEGWEGEMTQAMYAHVNKCIIFLKRINIEFLNLLKSP